MLSFGHTVRNIEQSEVADRRDADDPLRDIFHGSFPGK